jgi:hypothetical protein
VDVATSLIAIERLTNLDSPANRDAVVPDRAVRLRTLLAAAGLALAFADAWWFHTDLEYGTSLPANAAFAILALFLVVLAAAPLKAWPFSLMAVILLPLTFAGLWLGGMCAFG